MEMTYVGTLKKKILSMLQSMSGLPPTAWSTHAAGCEGQSAHLCGRSLRLWEAVGKSTWARLPASLPLSGSSYCKHMWALSFFHPFYFFLDGEKCLVFKWKFFCLPDMDSSKSKLTAPYI